MAEHEGTDAVGHHLHRDRCEQDARDPGQDHHAALAEQPVDRQPRIGSGRPQTSDRDAFEQAGVRLELVPSEAGYKSDSGYELLL